MDIDRRTLLRWSLPGIAAPFLGRPARAESAPAPLFVLIEGIGPATTSATLEAVLEPLLVASVPVALVLPMGAGSEGALPEDAGTLVRHLVTRFPELVEPVPEIPGLAGQSTYFRRRTASEALASLRQLLAPGPVSPPPLSVATKGVGTANLDALRALGVRQVIDTGTGPGGATTSTGCAMRMICMSGAARLDLTGTQDCGRWTTRALATKDAVAMVIDVSGAEGIPVQDLRRRSEEVVGAIAQAVQANRRFVSLPRDQIGWFAAAQPRRIALLLIRPTPGDAAAGQAFEAMQGALGARGLAFSVAGRPWEGDGPDACLALDGADAAKALPWFKAANEAGVSCALGAVAGALPPDLALGLDLLIGPGAWPAFDGDGPLRTGTLTLTDALSEGNATQARDLILTLDKTAYATEEARQATLAQLDGLVDAGGAVLGDLPDHMAATQEPDRLFAILRDTERAPPAPDPQGDLSREELLADARLAWQFFEKYSNAASGLCIATAHESDGTTYLHQELTMWDLASLLAALMAAQELGLIGDDDYAARTARIVAAIPTARISARRLPAAVVSVRSGAALSNDFNACDTGRLLSVLREVDAHPLTRGLAAEAVGRWDLDAIIPGGRANSVIKGRFVDQSETHCSHYTARAFFHWGFPVQSPYMIAEDGPVADRRMRLMERVRAIGPFGAEPLLLEGVEMPFSEPSAFLADLLLDRQRRGYEATGDLICVSEAPLDRAPWFMYQGLSLATPDHPWVVQTLDSGSEWQDESFWRAVRLVNTKAAYLWAATRPGAFSFRLARHVRDRARIEGAGFCPGVFSATGEPMNGYVDVNTNGIMLQAISYILRGRKPRFD
ncbi:DUF3131 domain-containing protein [Defluviimonas sp. WL0075]|uniref:DUF3131 domain-containing protein n=1 Tax=Albidovulum sediminicola TaxID=2984331 RepID=A0ABT2Z357_9RHOB|nr:DUF3131 domain-containing protein [Defluviimonas sp. WL0075]MCV2865541.1 DUF3131 domain-containing protein [Defluviimonas sp. WL0075]